MKYNEIVAITDSQLCDHIEAAENVLQRTIGSALITTCLVNSSENIFIDYGDGRIIKISF